jgi:hypothetical protein
MRMFWQQRTARALSAAVSASLNKEGGAPHGGRSTLRMVEQPGQYAGRKVMYFRVFDPAATDAGGRTVRQFDDLDDVTSLRQGHTEGDGTVVLNRIYPT